jgi:nucleoside-diphosphate-sugar epimerase
MKTVFVTGVTGFVGSQSAVELARRGYRVIGSTNSATGLRSPTAGVERKWVLHLDETVKPEIFAGVQALVHCAYDLRRDLMQANVAGTERIAQAAADAGVTHQIFISSYSSHNAAVSDYGRTKFVLQERFLAMGQAVVRPGLIVGPGGMFARLYQNINNRPVVPLVGGGGARLPIVGIADFSFALGTIVERELHGLFNLFNPELITLQDLFAAIRTASRSRTLLLPVPARLLATCLEIMERLGITLPINSGSIRALQDNQHIDDPSDLMQFIPKPLTLAEMVNAASSLLCEETRSTIAKTGR